jgi:histidinol phosphatase-like PHP family hydrolase
MIDYHVHTSMSYCAERTLGPDFYVSALAAKSKSSGVEGAAVTDHGMAVYFPEETAWRWEFIVKPEIFDAHRDAGNKRLDAHLRGLEKFAGAGIMPGFEAEMMEDGRLTLDPAFRKRLRVLIGSIHWLPMTRERGASPGEIYRYFDAHTNGLLDKGIDILGHPFRWLSTQMPLTDAMIKKLVADTMARGAALELNSHFKIDSDVRMLREAADAGALVAWGTDCHKAAEFGDFSYHYKILADAGLKISDLNLLDKKIKPEIKTGAA